MLEQEKLNNPEDGSGETSEQKAMSDALKKMAESFSQTENGSNINKGQKSESTPEEIKVEWEEILSNFPEKLQEEFREERQNPTQEDVEAYKSLRLLEPKPQSVSLEELLKNNGDIILRATPDVIEEINKNWGTKFDPSLSKVYDQNPDRVRKYSQMPAETAQPSVMIDGEIHFGVGRFVAALLRKDKELQVWNLSKKPENERSEMNPEFAKEVEDSVFSLDDKINILLVKAGLKPASLVSIDVKVWNDQEVERSTPKELAEKSSQVIENSGMVFMRRTKPEFTYEYKKPDGTLAPYNHEFISFLIGKDQESVDALARALESGDDELKGKAYGFSQTAIDAWLGRRTALDSTQVAPEISESPAYLFTPGKLSADNWQEEIKDGQRRADFIKRASPKLYKEFVGEKGNF